MIYAVILLAVRAAQEVLGVGGLYVAAVLGSLADVDAVAIAFAHFGSSGMGWPAAAAAIAAGMVTNTFVKLGIALTMGSPGFRRYVAAALGVMGIVGAAAGVLVMNL